MVVLRESRAGVVGLAIKIPSVQILHVTVAIVVQTVRQFTGIGEKIGVQIRMIELNTIIQKSDDDAGNPGQAGPGVGRMHIGFGYSAVQALIIQRPLVDE